MTVNFTRVKRSCRKTFQKQDSLDEEEFIVDAIDKYRKALRDCNYIQHLKSMNESMLFDALRREIFRISTIDIANSDFIIEEAAIPGLNGSMDSWLSFTEELVKELPFSQIELKKQWDILYAGTKQYLKVHKDFYTFNRMFFIKNHLIPLSGFLNDMQVAFEIPFFKKDAAIKSDASVNTSEINDRINIQDFCCVLYFNNNVFNN